MMVRVESDLDYLELAINGEPQRVVLRPDEVLVIGRDRSCQLVLEDRSVSRRHAEIRRDDDGWVMRDLDSRNGIHLDGQRTGTIPVRAGTEVRVGSPHDGPVLTFSVPAPRTPPPAAEPPPAAAPEPPPAAPEPPAAAPEPPAATPEPPAAAPEPFVPEPYVPEPYVPEPYVPEPFVPEPSAPEPAARAYPDPPAAEPAPAEPAGRPEIASFDASGTTTIGRSADCDIVLYDLLASRKHAEVRQVGAQHHLVDLGSTNGTYVNGQRIDRTVLRPGDTVSIGHAELTFDGQRLHERVDTGPTSLAAEGVCVDIGKHRIVNDVSFALEQGSLLGIIGPSGCGKSTLLRALTGLQQASAGKVTYDNRDLYADYGELRYRIGMVPQDDVLHPQLTVRRALRFAASLRFADDVTRKERSARVEDVMATLGLTQSARNRIDRLSGGQRKRTSVALELLTEPSMLCLDEPTSGLDPALDRDVMNELRALADRGRTILCVTHSVLHLDGCDRVMVMCKGGKVGYFGPPTEVLAFFEAENYADVFQKVTQEPDEWARRYRESDQYQRYVADPIAAHLASSPAPGGPGEAEPAAAMITESLTGPSRSNFPPSQEPASSGFQLPGGLSVQVPTPIAKVLSKARPSFLTRAKDPVAPIRQFMTLSLRMFAVITADRSYFLFLLGMPLILAGLSRAVPAEAGLGAASRIDALHLLVVLVTGAAFIGISSAVREIVSESVIYKRERAVGLNPGAYLAAKFVVLGIINVLQVTGFVWLTLIGRGGPDQTLVFEDSPMLETIVPIAMVTTSATMLGLVLSALARTVAQTTPVLVVVVMAMLMFSGAMIKLHGELVVNQFSWLFPSRWGFSAVASTMDLPGMLPAEQFQDPLWTHSAGSWWRAIILLVIQIAVFTAAARLAMRRLEPGRH